MKERPAEKLIDACRVPDTVPCGDFGLWKIQRQSVSLKLRRAVGLYPYDSITMLSRFTLATLHQEHGEIVMEDSPRELSRHLPILMAARGRILVSGLGLGCVLRGLLSKPEVEHVTVIEKDDDIIRAVWGEFMPERRCLLLQGDAETIQFPPGSYWDFAWHDVWSEEENLAIVHTRLLMRYQKMCGYQGAWMLPRWSKRLIKKLRILK